MKLYRNQSKVSSLPRFPRHINDAHIKGSPVPITQRDIQFFFAVVEGDYSFHSDEIERLTNNFLRGARHAGVSYPVVIQYNCSRKVTITTADKVPKEGNWEEIVRKGRMNVGRLVYLTVPDKAKPFKVFGIIDERHD